MKDFKHLSQKKLNRKRTTVIAIVTAFAVAAAAICTVSALSRFKLTDKDIESHVKTTHKMNVQIMTMGLNTEPKNLNTSKVSATNSAKETEPATEETLEETTTATDETESEPTVAETTYNYSGDVELLASVIYLESGSCSEYCQWLVGSAAMNLADANRGLDVVAHDYGMFEVAPDVDSCEPSELSKSVAQRVLSGDRDYAVNAFREGYYHEWATPYTNVDNVYFSTF